MGYRGLRSIAVAALTFALAGGAAQRALADDSCFYRGSMFSHGATACQSGSQFRCDDGEWEALRTPCSGSPQLSKTCQLGGINFSTGSASCQEGTQYRCEDGNWKRLGLNCATGDAPIRSVPSGRTCMFDGATVASNSTICRSGATYLCNDGEWVNIGTDCR
jgi:hypothetical protein